MLLCIGHAAPILDERCDTFFGEIALNAPASQTASMSTAPFWRWSLAFMLVCGFAFLSHAVPLAQTTNGHSDQGLAASGAAWVLAGQQEQPAPVKRSPVSNHSDGNELSSPIIGLLPTLQLLLLGLMLTGLRQYFRSQIHLLPSRANCSPCSPRAPPRSQSSV